MNSTNPFDYNIYKIPYYYIWHNEEYIDGIKLSNLQMRLEDENFYWSALFWNSIDYQWTPISLLYTEDQVSDAIEEGYQTFNMQFAPLYSRLLGRNEQRRQEEWRIEGQPNFLPKLMWRQSIKELSPTYLRQGPLWGLFSNERKFLKLLAARIGENIKKLESASHYLRQDKSHTITLKSYLLTLYYIIEVNSNRCKWNARFSDAIEKAFMRYRDFDLILANLDLIKYACTEAFGVAEWFYKLANIADTKLSKYEAEMLCTTLESLNCPHDLTPNPRSNPWYHHKI